MVEGPFFKPKAFSDCVNVKKDFIFDKLFCAKKLCQDFLTLTN